MRGQEWGSRVRVRSGVQSGGGEWGWRVGVESGVESGDVEGIVILSRKC